MNRTSLRSARESVRGHEGTIIALFGVILLVTSLAVPAVMASPEENVESADGRDGGKTVVSVENGNDASEVVLYDRQGAEEWSFSGADSYYNVDVLDNGSFLVAYGNRSDGSFETGFQIIDPRPEPHVVHQWSKPVPSLENDSIRDVDRLDTGEFIVADRHSEEIYTIDGSGEKNWTWDANRYYRDTEENGTIDLTDVDQTVEGRQDFMVTVRSQDQILFVNKSSGVEEVVNEGQHERLLQNPLDSQYIRDGRILTTDTSKHRVTEVQRSSETGIWEDVWSVRSANDVDLNRPRDIDRLSNGNSLITDRYNDRVVELNEKGVVVLTIQTPSHPYDAERLPEGESIRGISYVASLHGMIESYDGDRTLMTPVRDSLRFFFEVPAWLNGGWFFAALLGALSVLFGLALIAKQSTVQITDYLPSRRYHPPEQSRSFGDSVYEEDKAISALIAKNVDSRLSERYSLNDLALIMLGVLSMSYGSLLLFNTGNFDVQVLRVITTFSYEPPLSAMFACLLLYLFSFFCLVSVGADWSEKLTGAAWFTPLLYVGVGAIFLFNVYFEPHTRERAQGGKTDGYVLQTEGAEAFLAGQNPYAVNYGSEILAEVPGYFRTPLSSVFTISELSDPSNIVTHLDYPPTSFLWYVPAEVIGIEGVTWDVAMMALFVMLLVAMAPKALRLFVPVFFMLNWNMMLFPASYVPDTAWVLMVIGAIMTFRYPKTNAVLWAFAASYRPQPILVATYFAVFAYREFGTGYLKQWVPTGLFVTALLNIPFAVWTGFDQYVSLVSLPVRVTIPPGGVGPSMFLSTAEVTTYSVLEYKPLFTLMTVSAWLLTLAISYFYYDRMGVGILAFPGLVLWFHWRSFENYMLWYPLFVFAAYLVGFPHRDPMQTLHARLADVRERVRSRVRTDEDPLYVRSDD